MAPKQTTTTPEVAQKDPAEGRKGTGRTGRDAHIVILKSGEGFFGIDINLVQEIVLMQEITKVPGSVDFIAGMCDLRGRVVPVAEFATLLAQEPSERSDETRILVVENEGGHIGLIVDAVTEVMMVDGEKIEDATTLGTQEHEFIVAVAKLDDHLVSLVDMRRIMRSADRESLAKAA
jgi:purine-binding chemotaxis protein CheW